METLAEFADKYGKIYSIDVFGHRTIIVNDLDLMRRMTKEPVFTGRPLVASLSDMYSDGVQHGLVISNPPHSDELRTFTQKELRVLGYPRTRIEPLAMEEVTEYLATLENCARKSEPISTGFGSSPTQDTEFEGMKFYSGEHILYNVYYVHHDKKIWGDPFSFRPERHLSAEGDFVHNPNLIPFLMEKRQCFGEVMARDAMFLWLTNITHRFHLELSPESKANGVDMEAGFPIPKSFL